MSTPDYPDYQTPTAHAAAMLVTGQGVTKEIASFIAGGSAAAAPGGAGLLSNSSNIVATGTITVPLGVGSAHTVSMPRIGYEVNLSLTDHTAGGNGTPVAVDMLWSDSVSGLSVYEDTWQFVTGTPGNTHLIFGSGPVKGDTLKITVTNPGTNPVAIDYAVDVMNNSHIYPRDDWRTITMPAVAGFSLAVFALPEDLIASQAPSVGTGATATRLLPAYSGAAWLLGETSSNGNDAAFTIQNLSPNATTFTDVARVFTDSNGRVNQLIYLPRGQCQFLLHNNNAGTQTLKGSLYVARQPA